MPFETPAAMRGPYFVDRTDWNDAAVREHLCRLAQVVETTGSGVVITDLKGAIVWVNDGFARITGYSPEEAVGRIPGQLLQGPDTDRAETARVGAALRNRRRVATELINYSKTGRRYWLGMKIEPLLDASGQPNGFMSIQTEITERHERNRALEQLTARFNMATHAARIGIYEFSVDLKDVWWSQEMWEIFGQDPLVFHPSAEAWFNLIHPEDRGRVRANDGSNGLGRTAPGLQYRIIRPDNTVRHVHSIATDDGMVIAGALLDVTERVEADERERLLQQRLRENSHHAGMAEIATGVLHNVGNVLNSLGIANTAARRDLKALRVEKLRQAAGAIYDNRSKLGAFLTEDACGKHLPDYLSALAAQMSTQVETLQAELETTEGLLDHLRDIVGAQQVLAHVGGLRELIDLASLTESALLVRASDLAQMQVSRQFDELPLVMTDRHKLMQILVNLISNASDAVKASPLKSRRILVRIAREEDHALIVIEDSGIGMSAETLERLWQFGFTTKKNGHGFGLHSSANAAHEIGASLSAHSEGLGLGSRFILRLPLTCQQPALAGVAA